MRVVEKIEKLGQETSCSLSAGLNQHIKEFPEPQVVDLAQRFDPICGSWYASSAIHVTLKAEDDSSSRIGSSDLMKAILLGSTRKIETVRAFFLVMANGPK